MRKKKTAAVPPWLSGPAYLADGWIETAVGAAREGGFSAGDDFIGILVHFEFYPIGGSLADMLAFPWSHVNTAKLVPKADLPPAVIEAHADIFRSASKDDPYVVVGWLTSQGGIPRSDLFTLISSTGNKSSQEWLEILRKKGVEVELPS